MSPFGHSLAAASGLPDRRVTLWTHAASDHAISCIAEPHPLGHELRYVLNGRLLMSRVFDSWDRVRKQAQTWRERL